MFTIVQLNQVVSGFSGTMSSVDYASDIVEKQKTINLKSLGLISEDVKFGINIDKKYESRFDNLKNPFLVYRAYIIDNAHNIKQELKLFECKMDNDPSKEFYNLAWFRKTYCMDLQYQYLLGDYTTNPDQSNLINIQAIRCNKNNAIFAGVECASEEEYQDFVNANVYFYIDENKIEYKNFRKKIT